MNRKPSSTPPRVFARQQVSIAPEPPSGILPVTRASVSSPNGGKTEVVVPFPESFLPTTRVRSTLLLASVTAIRESGRYEAYFDRLDPAFERDVVGALAGTWVSIDAARAHYRACDALGLSAAEQMTIGRKTGDGLKQHLTRATRIVSRALGVDPWFIFTQFNRFWGRTFDGGGVSVLRLGPKEAEVVYGRCALLESSYFRSALRGVAVGLLGAVTLRSFMSELPATRRSEEARYRFSWV